MKTIKLLFASVITLIAVHSVNAQTGKETILDHSTTQTVKVYGECGMCKKRIEKAASTVEGVQSASWNEDSKVLTVKYDLFTKETMDSVQRKIAAAGHDTEKYKADNAVYQKLPDCCHYQRKQ